jgi:Domain of unknown function (DUF1707)
MSAPSSPIWLLAATRRRVSYSDLRISDAERAEVTDLLSRHYGDGRLDQAEFNERLDQAMSAKTYRDLGGLFADLPRTETADSSEASAAVARNPHRHPNLRDLSRGLFVILVVLIAAAAGRALVWSLHPWVWIAIIGAIILYATRTPRGTS